VVLVSDFSCRCKNGWKVYTALTLFVWKYVLPSAWFYRSKTNLLRERGHNFEPYEYNYKFFTQSFVVNCLSRSRLPCYLLLCDVFIFCIITNFLLMLTYIRLICAPIKFTCSLTYLIVRDRWSLWVSAHLCLNCFDFYSPIAKNTESVANAHFGLHVRQIWDLNNLVLK